MSSKPLVYASSADHHPQTDLNLQSPLIVHLNRGPGGEESNVTPNAPHLNFERVMGANELSYYLPSRANGANDILLSFRFTCSPGFITPRRIHLAWAILRLLHPLLSCSIKMEADKYDQARFVYNAPPSPTAAIIEARNHCDIFTNKSGEQLLDMFSNGPRLLSNERQCRLLVNIPPSTPSQEKKMHDILIWCGHCASDGMSVHSAGNELLSLLGGHSLLSPVARSEEELHHLLEEEWEKRWGRNQGAVYMPGGFIPIPNAAEGRLGSGGRMKEAADRVALLNNSEKILGGHVFPRIKPSSPVHNSKVKTFIIPQHHTRSILALCKSKGVSVTNTTFVLMTFAWIRLVASRTDPRNTRVSEAERKLWKTLGDERMPIMMYTAVNLRPYFYTALTPHPLESRIFLILGYLNVALPGFLPRIALEKCNTEEEKRKVLEGTFWLRARSIRDQHKKILQSPLFASRNRAMGKERAARSKAWAVMDDHAEETKRRKMKGLPPPPPLPTSPVPQAGSPGDGGKKKPPSVPLIGLSLFGNFDTLYAPTNFPALDVVDLLSTNRKNTGAMLLMGYTFRGKLYSTLGWDARCFEPGVVEEFWGNYEEALKEFLIPGGGGKDVTFERGLECHGKEVEARL